MTPDEARQWAARIAAGDVRALARALTWIENRDARGEALLGVVESSARSVVRVGITGAPGVGKSSLIGAMIARLRQRGEPVAVLAVDPTSPLSGGALLGDRVRMQPEAEDAGVFIRSLASRGGVGGLAACTGEATDLIAHAGYPLVLIETVGVGQLEMAVVEEADHVILVLSPDSGDTIQFLKGGVIEVVDRLLLNKNDRPGADEVLRVIEELTHEWQRPPPLSVSCTAETGLDEVVDLLLELRQRELAEGDRVARLARRLGRRAEEAWLAAGWQRVGGNEAAERAAARVTAGTATLAEVLAELRG